LEVAFRKHSCYVRTKDGVDLLKGSWGSNLYTISVEDMMKSSPICLLSKASKNNSWLWHRQLNHLNFSTINDLARKDLVRGLPRLKFEKDHLCSAGSLEDIPKINTTKIEYLYAKEHNIQERNKIQVLKCKCAPHLPIVRRTSPQVRNEGSKILDSIEGTLLEKEVFSEFNEFIAMAEDENSESESDTEEPPFE
ncbi:retrovirus-related pol polyprotein from transposon TNT 1-94, partial [Tanacetum coccineum]